MPFGYQRIYINDIASVYYYLNGLHKWIEYKSSKTIRTQFFTHTMLRFQHYLSRSYNIILPDSVF